MDTTRDREMILHPMRWPLLVLPLKRDNPFQSGNQAVFCPKLSILEVKEDQPIEIRIGTMFDKFTELPTREYENVDALLADGWRVD